MFGCWGGFFCFGVFVCLILDQSVRSSYQPMTSLAYIHDCHCCYDERSIDQKKRTVCTCFGHPLRSRFILCQQIAQTYFSAPDRGSVGVSNSCALWRFKPSKEPSQLMCFLMLCIASKFHAMSFFLFRIYSESYSESHSETYSETSTT